LAFYDEFHGENIEQAYNECKELIPIQELSNEEKMIMESLAHIQTQTILPHNFTTKDQVPEEIKKKLVKQRSITKLKKNAKKPMRKPHEIIAQTMLNASHTPPIHTAYIPNIQYTSFTQAKQDAIREHKYILLKIEANHCKPCEQLNTTLSTNDHIKKMINEHTKAVKINTSFDAVPLGLSNRGTPTVFLIEPESNRVVMKLEPEEVGELEESLNIFIDNGSPQSKLVGLEKINSLNQSLTQLIEN
jgi:hypothetical protein